MHRDPKYMKGGVETFQKIVDRKANKKLHYSMEPGKIV